MKYFSPYQFKSAHKSGNRPIDDCLVLKASTGIPEVLGERTVKFVISTDAVDRDNDTIDQKGWKLDNFRKNAVCLWSHKSSDPPIGKVIDIGLEGGVLKATIEFVPADNPFVGDRAEGVLRMCREGFISATSVGFAPIEWDLTEDKARGADGWSPGADIKRQELYEVSIVSLPANPEALIERPAAETPKSTVEAAANTFQLNNSRARRQRILSHLEITGSTA